MKSLIGQKGMKLAQMANWSASSLAQLSGVSIRTLQMYFRKSFGQGPKAWLASERQKRAIILLRQGCSIKETAAQLGYKHTHHFSRDFKKRWNRLPSQMTCDKALTPLKLRVLV